MKRTLSTLLLLIAFISVQAQQPKSVLFKLKFKPQHSYAALMKMNMNMEMKTDGDSTATTDGQPNQMAMHMTMNMPMTYTTGKLAADKSMPLFIKYGNLENTININGQEMKGPANPISGLTIGGKIVNDNIDLQTVSGNTMPAEQKKALTDMVNTMINQVKYPGKPMVIGETFTQEVPMNFPAGGQSFQMNVKVIYKLLDIKNNVAYFDIDQNLLADMTTPDNFKMKMQGSGNGKMEYSIKDDFMTNMASNINFTYTMNSEKGAMTGNVKATTDYSTVISAVKN